MGDHWNTSSLSAKHIKANFPEFIEVQMVEGNAKATKDREKEIRI